jgi:type I restriction enzyme M protein
MAETAIRNHAAFIWSVADLLRGDYRQSDYGRVILPLVVIRRLDCVLEPTKAAVLKRKSELEGKIENLEVVLKSVAGQQFFNTSKLDFKRLLEDSANVGDNLRAYIAGFSQAARDVIAKFDFQTQITRMERANLLYLVLGKFADIDLHPNVVSNIEMGYLYEELVRRFSELSNETAGEHFTPREVIRLMVNLLFIEDSDLLTKPGIVKTLYDPACGTGGMLSVAEDHLRKLNPQARLEVFGQELNDETYAICRSDMMLKGQDASRIYSGNSFDRDGLPDQQFDYMLANPPFGVEWKKVEDAVKKEAQMKGFAGRFGAGLPRINDGSFLFLQHMLSKMKPPEDGGSRLAIVFNGSPLFTGGAGSGESEIRRWIIENDWLEAVVALPDQLFYNTGISTYFWVLTNRKSAHRRGKIQLVDARELFTKMRKSLGNKRNEISDTQIEEITRLYGELAEGEQAKILPNEAFGYMRITVERPLRLRRNGLAKGVTPAQLKELLKTADADEAADAVTDRNGSPYPDPALRDQENVPLPLMPVSYEKDVTDRLSRLEYLTAVNDYVKAEVLPWVPDAWVDGEKTRVGYEIPLTRHFYKYVPPRPLAEIDAEIKTLEHSIQELLNRVSSG